MIPYILTFIAGVIFGWGVGLAAHFIFRERPIGNLRVDHSDPEGPYLFLELEKNPEALKTKNEVMLRVKFQDYISQK